MRKVFQFRAFPYKASLLELVSIPLLALLCCPLLFSYATGEADRPGEVNLTVERKMICAEHGETVYINCYLNVRHANMSENAWSLSWKAEGHLGSTSRFKKVSETRTVRRNSSMLTLTSGLSVSANWSDAVASRVFICVAGYRSSKAEVHNQEANESVVVRIKPWPITNITFRFSETAAGKIIVEAFWKSLESTHVYMLKYCIMLNTQRQTSRHYGTARSECLFREKDSYYKVPHTSGVMCKATWNLGGHTPHKYREHRVYVVSQRMGCETNGKKHGFCLDYYPNVFSALCPNKLETLYFIPQPVIHVNVSAINGRKVQVFWSNFPKIYKDFRNYIVRYNCSTNVVVYKNETPKTSITLYGNRDFHPYRPYALCEFCVWARIKKTDVLSKSVCKTARLHEEVPSASPSFGCFENDCETKSDGIERNVTVTWVLPQEEEWNGVLKKVKLIFIYNRTLIEVSDSNLTKRATVLRLAINSSYVIKIVACNKEGCSSPGNSFTIPPLPPHETLSTLPKRSAAGKDSTTRNVLAMAIGFPVGAVVFVVCFVFWFFKSWKVRKDLLRKDPLPDIEEPKDYENVVTSDPGDGEYCNEAEPSDAT